MKNIKVFEDFNKKQVFPSEEFGKKTKVDWIYKKWNLPFGKSEDETYMALNKAFDALEVEKTKEYASTAIIGMYNTLIRDNDEFQKMEVPESYGQVYDILLGAISRFCFEDIKFYSKLTMDERYSYNQNPQTLKRLSSIRKKTGIDYLGWVLSPLTLDRLEKQLGIK